MYDRGPVRLTMRVPGGRGRPYPEQMVREAIARLDAGESPDALARVLGVARCTVYRWRRARGWDRPALGPVGETRRFWKSGAAVAARWRNLEEAERDIAALEGGTIDLDALTMAVKRLAAARRVHEGGGTWPDGRWEERRRPGRRVPPG